MWPCGTAINWELLAGIGGPPRLLASFVGRDDRLTIFIAKLATDHRFSRGLSGRSRCESRRQTFPACAAPRDRPARGCVRLLHLPDEAPAISQPPAFRCSPS